MEFKFNTKGCKTRLRVTEAAFRNSFDVEAIHPFNDVWLYSYCLGGDGTTLAARAFTSEEQKQTSTWRELAAIHETWTDHKVLNFFKGSKVVHYSL